MPTAGLPSWADQRAGLCSHPQRAVSLLLTTCERDQIPPGSPAAGPGADGPRNWPFHMLLTHLPLALKTHLLALEHGAKPRDRVCRSHRPACPRAPAHPMCSSLPCFLKSRAPVAQAPRERGDPSLGQLVYGHQLPERMERGDPPFLPDPPGCRFRSLPLRSRQDGGEPGSGALPYAWAPPA